MNEFLFSAIQGISEFLPISSNMHIIIAEKLMNISSKSLSVELHIGTLMSIVIYFIKDILILIKSLFNPKSDEFKYVISIIIATIPCIVVGFLINKFIPDIKNSISIFAFLLFGILLIIAERSDQKYNTINYFYALLIGMSQIIAFIPGASRLGCTLIAGRFLKINRFTITKFSLFMSIPTVAGAATLMILDKCQSGNLSLEIKTIILTFCFGMFSLKLLFKYISRHSFIIFGYYRIIMSIVIYTLLKLSIIII